MGSRRRTAKPRGFVRQNIFVLAQLIGNKLHAWHGMLGNCQKDKFEKHLQAIKSGDITDDGLSVRRELFCHYGNGDLKNKAIISVKSKFPHCSTFYKMKVNALFKSPSLAHVLLCMHEAGKYIPDASEMANCNRCGMCMGHLSILAFKTKAIVGKHTNDLSMYAGG